MSHRIIRLRQARQDLIETAVYLDERNPEAATRFLAAVEETLGYRRDARAGAACSFRHPLLAGLRMLPVRGFERHLVFYRLAGDALELIRVYHAARDVDEIDPKTA